MGWFAHHPAGEVIEQQCKANGNTITLNILWEKKVSWSRAAPTCQLFNRTVDFYNRARAYQGKFTTLDQCSHHDYHQAILATQFNSFAKGKVVYERCASHREAMPGPFVYDRLHSLLGNGVFNSDGKSNFGRLV